MNFNKSSSVIRKWQNVQNMAFASRSCLTESSATDALVILE